MSLKIWSLQHSSFAIVLKVPWRNNSKNLASENRMNGNCVFWIFLSSCLERKRCANLFAAARSCAFLFRKHCSSYRHFMLNEVLWEMTHPLMKKTAGRGVDCVPIDAWYFWCSTTVTIYFVREARCLWSLADWPTEICTATNIALVAPQKIGNNSNRIN